MDGRGDGDREEGRLETGGWRVAGRWTWWMWMWTVDGGDKNRITGCLGWADLHLNQRRGRGGRREKIRAGGREKM